MPIFGPLVNILKSRKVIVGAITFLVDVLIAYLPALNSSEDVLIAAFTALALAIIGGIAYEDGKAKAAGIFPAPGETE